MGMARGMIQKAVSTSSSCSQIPQPAYSYCCHKMSLSSLSLANIRCACVADTLFDRILSKLCQIFPTYRSEPKIKRPLKWLHHSQWHLVSPQHRTHAKVVVKFSKKCNLGRNLEVNVQSYATWSTALNSNFYSFKGGYKPFLVFWQYSPQ